MVDEVDRYEGMPRPGTRGWVMWNRKCRVQGVITAIDHVGGVPHALVMLWLKGMTEADEPLHLICARDEMEIIPAAEQSALS